MKPIKNIKELHVILLDMAKTFHQICEQERIPYYMVGGTQLGAIRHNGFIPWDDDMDFGVPRLYYSRLKDALRKNLPEYYSVLDKEDGIIATGFFKLVDNRTVHSHHWEENPNRQFGVNIDIFPLDPLKHRWKRKLIDLLTKIQMYKVLSTKGRPFFKRLLAYFVKAILFWQNRSGMTEFIENYLLENEGPYITNIYGVYGSRETLNAELFGTPVLFTFEGTQLYGVEKPHEYLKAIYGDYMKLPPKEKQHTHIIDMYWK